MKRSHAATFALLAAAAASLWLWAAQQRQPSAPQPDLAANLPAGALLTIESPDFAHLLTDWNSSTEQAAWTHSASFSIFANSRLYGRLADAQKDFAGVAGSGIDARFLASVAGTQSIFACYDIGNLEFLYITRLTPGQADKLDLLTRRASFTQRQAGGTSFYLRQRAAPDEQEGGPQQRRTVAFAQRDGWFLLATREDLLAGALLLMQANSRSQSVSPSIAQSVAGEGWYTAAQAASPAQHGELHMLLNLDRLTHTPQFRSYWIQNNITDTRRYRAAAVDLYREPGRFREERALLPIDPIDPAALAPQNEPRHESQNDDVAALAALTPDRAGVFRASAAPTAAAALAELRDKVLERAPAPPTSNQVSPTVDLAVDLAGSVSDLETRIDAPQPAAEAPDAWLKPLQNALTAAPLTAMLSVSRSAPQQDALFIPLQSLVALRSSHPWDRQQLANALLQSLRSRLTVGVVGLAWTPRTLNGHALFVLSGGQPVALAVEGNTAFVSTDAALLAETLAHTSSSPARLQPATVIAEFHHQQEQATFLQLTGTLQRSHVSTPADGQARDAMSPTSPAEGITPSFLHDNLGSLSRAFQSLATERFVERRDGPLLHQTVLYQWSLPAAAPAAAKSSGQ